MNSIGLMQNLLIRGYEVAFRVFPGDGGFSCCVEREGQFPGGRPWSWGKDMDAALMRAAESANALRQPQTSTDMP